MEQQWEASQCGYRQGGFFVDLDESVGVFVEVTLIDSGLRVSLNISLPPFASVKFLSDLVVVSYSNGRQFEGALIAAAPKSLSGRPIMETLIADEPPSRTEDPDRIVSFHEYLYTATIEGEFPDDIVVIFPSFFVNGTEYKLDLIDMLRVEKLSLLTC